MNNYFIKEGYKIQKANFTLDDNRKTTYWDENAIKLNSFYQWDVYKYVSELVKNTKYNKVVDIGCGASKKLKKLIKPYVKEVIGIDQDSVINFCREKYPDITFFADNFESLNSSSNSCMHDVDIIICSDVIEHLVDPDVLLNYIKNIANKDTLIVISTPERDLLRGKDCMSSEKPEHVREWNKEEFAKYIENSGLEILSHKVLPFIKFDLFSKECRYLRKVIKKRTGTVDTCQMVVCKIV